MSSTVICQNIQSLSAGQAWAAVSTEGLVIYTLDSGIVFDPLDLSIDVTPEAVIDAIKSHDLLTAIVLSFRLSDQKLLQKCVEAVSPADGMCVGYKSTAQLRALQAYLLSAPTVLTDCRTAVIVGFVCVIIVITMRTSFLSLCGCHLLTQGDAAGAVCVCMEAGLGLRRSD